VNPAHFFFLFPVGIFFRRQPPVYRFSLSFSLSHPQTRPLLSSGRIHLFFGRTWGMTYAHPPAFFFADDDVRFFTAPLS